jgi:hypothetical protein
VFDSEIWKASRMPPMKDFILCQPSLGTAAEESTARTRSRLWLQAVGGKNRLA